MDPIIELNLREIGLNKILGCDEVGRGSLAAEVCTAAVMLPVNHRIKGINDSKKLTPKRREELAEQIFEQAFDVQLAIAPHTTVDRINIYAAVKQCIHKTIVNFKINPDMVVIDGEFTEFKGDISIPYPHIIVPKADCMSENVAAASIIAKVCRDRMMVEWDKVYPEYGFGEHKGYGTKKHIDALLKYGPCPIHRRSFSAGGRKIGEFDA